jgi:hypothetical protein
MMICPAMMEAKVAATPILGMTNIEMVRYMTPKDLRTAAISELLTKPADCLYQKIGRQTTK